MRITYRGDHADVAVEASGTEAGAVRFAIPPGFTLKSQSTLPGRAVYRYTGADGGILDINVTQGRFDGAVDTEEAETEPLTIAGREAFLSEKNGRMTLVAFHLGQTIRVFTTLERGEAVALIESATIIEEEFP